MESIGILGAGTWGIALARMLSLSGYSTTVWTRNAGHAQRLTRGRMHPNLPGVRLPEEIVFTASLEAACRHKQVLLFAIPSVGIREVAALAARWMEENVILVNAAKGIESGTLAFLSDVLREEAEKAGREAHIVVLSGPTHAEEVARDLPTTIVSASEDEAAARRVQDIFMKSCMRVYTNPDVRGVELCGALKNVVALAAGISDGLGYGDNAKAAIVTRGLAEMERLGRAMGCREQTFFGLAGVGDLIVTATSVHSRNHQAGIYIGQGLSAESAKAKVGMVVESLNALPAAIALAKRYGVEMPILFAVHAVIAGMVRPEEAVLQLMSREKKAERQFIIPAVETPSNL